MTLIKRSDDGRCTFYEEGHKYTLELKKELIVCKSVTSMVGEHFEPFDAKAVAKKMADFQKIKNGRKFKKGEEITALDRKKATQKYWRKEWEESALHGTRVHEALENYVNKEEDTSHLKEQRDFKKYEQGVKFLHWFFEEHLEVSLDSVKFYAEVIVYNEQYQVAGQIDLLANVNDKYYIIDWKTSRKIAMKGYNGKKGVSEVTKDLDSCEYIKYSLQLETYKQIIDKDVDSCYIVHLMEDDFQTYQSKELDSHVKSILQQRLEEVTTA